MEWKKRKKRIKLVYMAILVQVFCVRALLICIMDKKDGYETSKFVKAELNDIRVF